MSEPRKHHHTSAFYLAGFTVTDADDGRLRVLDRNDGRSFGGTPRTVGYERDLFRLDSHAEDPNIVERAYAEIEGKCAPALRRLVDDSTAPDDEDVAVVLNLVAVLATRTPGFRHAVETFIADVGKKVASLALAKTESYERFLEAEEAKGVDTSDYPSRGEIREAIQSGALAVEANSEFVTAQAFESSPWIYDMLVRRSWMIGRVIDQSSTGPIVTSDRPVTIHWTGAASPPAWAGPGFMSPNTEVQFPLDRRHVLTGHWAETPGERVELDRRAVALVNGRTVAGAHRQIYSVSDRFYALDFEGAVTTGGAFLRGLSGGRGDHLSHGS